GRWYGEIQNRLRLAYIAATIAEGLLVLLHRHAVQGDSLFNAGRLQRNEPGLIGDPQYKQVGGHMITKQPFGNGASINVQILRSFCIGINVAPDGRLGWEEYAVVAD